MKFKPFTHPRFCPILIRRRIGEEMADMIALYGTFLFSRGRRILPDSVRTDAAYRAAKYRLRKAGVIAYRRTGGRDPMLKLTAEGETLAHQRLLHQRAPWPKSWNGVWYLLMYDVPETSRKYRESLRTFLARRRMGGLQKSAWITPEDIRADYDDLVKAAGLNAFAYLLQVRSAGDASDDDIVRAAWDVDTLRDQQAWYLKAGEENLKRLRRGVLTLHEMEQLAREESAAFLTVMKNDPLLPRPLWPDGYLGERAWNFHHKFIKEMSRMLQKAA